MSWRVYLVRCRDDSLYCGITNDLEKRILMHNAGRGGRYTRSRRPVRLFWSTPCSTRSEALQLEALVKKLAPKEKERLSDM